MSILSFRQFIGDVHGTRERFKYNKMLAFKKYGFEKYFLWSFDFVPTPKHNFKLIIVYSYIGIDTMILNVIDLLCVHEYKSIYRQTSATNEFEINNKGALQKYFLYLYIHRSKKQN